MKIFIPLLFIGYFWSPDYKDYPPPPYDTTKQEVPSIKPSSAADPERLVPNIKIDTIANKAANAPLSTGERRPTLIEQPGSKDVVSIQPAPDNSRLIQAIRLLKIIIGLLILISIAGFLFLYFKIKKMSHDSCLKNQMIESHTRDVENLKNFLVSNNLLNKIADFHLGNISKTIEELINKYLNESHSNQEKDNEIELLKTSLQQIKQEEAKKSGTPAASSTQALTQFVPYSNSQPEISIKSEVILTAGPRKDTSGNDTELGEDVAGIVSLHEETFFWLLDGTSDSAAITSIDRENVHEPSHIFSSRLLAQNLGHYIQKNIHRCFSNQIALEHLLKEACDHVSGEWEKRINNELPDKKESIRQMIRKGYKLLCSTTVIMGRLLNNGHLYALRAGDSKIFPFKQVNGQSVLDREFKFTSDPKEDYDRIGFRLDFDESTTAFAIKRNIPRWGTATCEDIHIAFAFSDGIGRITEAQLASNNPGIVDVIRENIGRIPQKTFDDKSLIILERVSSNADAGTPKRTGI